MKKDIKRRAAHLPVSALGFLALFWLLTGAVFAGGPGTSGGAFLSVGQGARSAALGGTGAAASGLEAAGWNPAGLADLAGAQAQFTRLNWLETVTFDDVLLGLGTRRGGYALWVRRVGMDPLAGYDENGQPAADYDASDTAVSLAFGRTYGRWSAGASARFISSRIADEGASGGAIDAGFRYAPSSAAVVGFSIRNLGPGLKFDRELDPLPAAARLGGALTLRVPEGALSLYLDAEKPRDRRVDLYAGAEYTSTRRRGVAFSLRGGFRTRVEGLSSSDAFTAGAGLAAGGFSLDYAYAPYGALGAASRITAGWSFGAGAAGKRD